MSLLLFHVFSFCIEQIKDDTQWMWLKNGFVWFVLISISSHQIFNYCILTILFYLFIPSDFLFLPHKNTHFTPQMNHKMNVRTYKKRLYEIQCHLSYSYKGYSQWTSLEFFFLQFFFHSDADLWLCWTE